MISFLISSAFRPKRLCSVPNNGLYIYNSLIADTMYRVKTLQSWNWTSHTTQTWRLCRLLRQQNRRVTRVWSHHHQSQCHRM